MTVRLAEVSRWYRDIEGKGHGIIKEYDHAVWTLCGKTRSKSMGGIQEHMPPMVCHECREVLSFPSTELISDS